MTFAADITGNVDFAVAATVTLVSTTAVFALLTALRVNVFRWLLAVVGIVAVAYHGYALIRTILLRRADASEDLVTHELCHVWQMQHRPLAMPLSYLWQGYRDNPHEIEARAAAEQTRPD